ncbi:MAG: alpha/beta hydrolase [Thiobacillus sp.]|nr:alpha/beta hydrolase [Thiobacillus sp.]
MRVYLLCLLISAFPAAAHAVIAQQEMRPGIGASAEYLVGERSKPAVLLVHGFLQTREFSTVATLARGLHDSGYTVLAPTLSLNVPNRSQSLACEAVHKHSLEDDVAEIGRWVAWLKSHGHRSIVLVGHSFGSLQLLAYLSLKPDPAVKAYIGASLVEAQIGTADRPALIGQLEARMHGKQRALVAQTLSFCRKYPSTPEGLLSYVRWDQARVLAALKQSPVGVKLIMGDADTLLGQGWLKTLQHVQVPMVIVAGANHFMDGSHEFDLLEHALKSLDTIQQAPTR